MTKMIHVTSTPPGAAISLDGGAIGKNTPADVPLTRAQAAQRSIRVSLRKSGFAPWGKSLTPSDFQPEAEQLAKICHMCCERVKTAVGLLANLSAPQAILKTCEEIDRLESDADRVMRSAMSQLFRDESDLKQVFKLRSVYMLLEEITDRCEDVANIIEGIVLEHS